MLGDDVEIYSKRRERVVEKLERWRYVLQRRRMKVSFPFMGQHSGSSVSILARLLHLLLSH